MSKTKRHQNRSRIPHLNVRAIFLLTVALFLVRSSSGQPTNGGLLVKSENVQDLNKYLKLSMSNRIDTTQCTTLIKVANILWYKKHEGEKTLDSCYHFARRAFDMSEHLRFIEGTNDAGLVLCKIYLEKKDPGSTAAIIKKTYDEQRVRLLLILAEYYTFKFQPEDKKNFNAALPLIAEAMKIGQRIRAEQWTDQCSLLLGKHHFKDGNFRAGNNAISSVALKYERSGNYELAAHFWSELGTYMPESDDTYKYIIVSHQKAVKFYLMAGEKKKAAYSLRDLAWANGNHNNTDSAEAQFLRCVSILNSIHERPSINTLRMIGDFYRFRGKYDKALIYALEGLRDARDESEKNEFYMVIALVYELLGELKKSLYYYQIVYDYAEQHNGDFLFEHAYKLANLTARNGEPERALRFLSRFEKWHPPILYNYKQLFAHAKGNIFSLLHNYRSAENYYQQMLRLDPAVQLENGRHRNNGITLAGCGANFLAGKFYADRGNYQLGGLYLKRSLVNPQYLDYQQELETYQLLAQADSAAGDFRSAFEHYKKFKMLNDSVVNAETKRKVSELNIRFETAQRLKDIRLLRNRERMQRSEIEKSALVRNVTIGGAVLLAISAVIAFMAYRNKQRVNKELQRQRDQIDQKNTSMRSLLRENEVFLNEKDQHLKEKDWLLKEIHHRVKNNLQIVISLLNSQSKYLNDPDTLNALQGSQNRIFSISLIHQKLYQADNVSGISFLNYINELTSYLSGSLDPEKKVRFKIEADDVVLDVSQAVPIGLITNEAVTNAMKHAFNGKDEGVIYIVFKRDAEEWLNLQIRDNGTGLADLKSIENADTLGMTLMKGLSEQLKGTFSLDTTSGVHIQIRWHQNKLKR